MGYFISKGWKQKKYKIVEDLLDVAISVMCLKCPRCHDELVTIRKL